MKRYLIKETVIATKNNPNFAGESHVVYLGAGHMKHCYCQIADYEISDKNMLNIIIKHLANQYGYRSLRACKCAIAAESKRCLAETARFNHHTFELEPIEVEV